MIIILLQMMSSTKLFDTMLHAATIREAIDEAGKVKQDHVQLTSKEGHAHIV